ncbi:MAG TPA: hypothetical protein VFC03_12825 [Acidimicrobiales bacterium]|nr:hypothetical protein [Acidimicrobiales bacterium]
MPTIEGSSPFLGSGLQSHFWAIKRMIATFQATQPREEIGMPRMVITHSVVDVEKWLEGKAERVAIVSGMGVTNVVDLVAQDGSNQIAVTGETEDPEAVLAAISSPPPDELAAMERHGVIPPLTVYVEK